MNAKRNLKSPRGTIHRKKSGFAKKFNYKGDEPCQKKELAKKF
ncbi:hypothetical protein KKC_10951 [Listeria fleischmannii subsp. coloradonensis]|nr:hypothetical protein KKC_10951 [Listeria fleischmannii subsp. coloradonensis]